MGLDMYLNAKRFLWHNEEELSKQIAEKFPEIGDKRVKEISDEAAYWRKSNQIHKWFVDNVQEGTDDCGTYEVSRDQLQNLIDLIDIVLSDKRKAQALLPTESGFFFGSEKYDEYYYSDLEDTKRMLTDLVDKEKWQGWYFEYHASW